MSASRPLGRAWRGEENLRRGGGLARVRERCKKQTPRRRPLPRRRAARGDHERVACVPRSVIYPRRFAEESIRDRVDRFWFGTRNSAALNSGFRWNDG